MFRQVGIGTRTQITVNRTDMNINGLSFRQVVMERKSFTVDCHRDNPGNEMINWAMGADMLIILLLVSLKRCYD